MLYPSVATERLSEHVDVQGFENPDLTSTHSYGVLKPYLGVEAENKGFSSWDKFGKKTSQGQIDFSVWVSIILVVIILAWYSSCYVLYTHYHASTDH